MKVEQQLQLAFSQFNSQFLDFKNVRTNYISKIKNALTSPIALASAVGVGFLTTYIVKRPHTVASAANPHVFITQRIRRGTRFALKAYALWTALRGGNAVIDRTVKT